MASLFQTRATLLAYSLIVIVASSLYLANVVLPLHTLSQRPAVASDYSPRADTLAPADTLAGDVSSAGWSALAMLFLALPAALGLAFSATSARLALSPLERVIWLAISVISLTLFFLTANAANMFVDQLMG